jgi:hypothetical protein
MKAKSSSCRNRERSEIIILRWKQLKKGAFDMGFKIKEFNRFHIHINRLSDTAKQELPKWVEALGYQFLEEVKREIIRTKTVDTRRLLNSFTKGDSGNIWRIESGGLTLELGTSVLYSVWVNDGHMQSRRFVPGHWNGSRFEYDPNADTGMMLTAKWIEGKHFFENACSIFRQLFNKSLEKKMAEWIKRG